MADAAEQPKDQEQPSKVHPMVVFREQLATRVAEFRAVLPSHISVERFQRTAVTAVQINPELIAVDRRSLFNALLRAANDGCIPDGRQGAIVVFNDNNSRSPTYKQQVAQWMIMVQGMRDRFVNSGHFKEVHAEVVREGDSFRYWIDEYGPHINHEPADNPGAKVIKAYALAIMKDGGRGIRVMNRADVDRRRAISRGKDGPMWRDWYDEAAKKSVLRSLYKGLPSSSDDLDRLVERDQELYEFEANKELPNDLRSEHQVPTGVAAALDQFGGRAPAAAEDATSEAPQGAATTEETQQQQASEQEPDHGSQQEAAQSATDVARARGKQARREGVQRRAIPGEYRTPEREAEANAWREGWDAPDDSK